MGSLTWPLPSYPKSAVLSTHGKPIFRTADCNSASDETTAKFAHGIPEARRNSFSRRRFWQMASTFAEGWLGTERATNSTVAGGMFSNSKVIRPQPSAKRVSAAVSDQSAVTCSSAIAAAQAPAEGSKVRTL